jgi:phosphopantetheinyl transferase (holo-ACP synthase)
MAYDRDVPPDATMSVSDTAPRAAVPSSLTIRLAGPAARVLFTPEAQSADDLTRWRDIVNTRKREEWEVSRALLAYVRGEVGERDGALARDAVTTSSARASDARGEAFLSGGGSVQQVRVQSAVPLAPAGVALSLSHSGGYAATAASRVAVRVGVDLECERPRDFSRLARFAFTEHEYAQLEALTTEAERVERFYILWTLKEAFAKALSLPLLGSLRQCAFLHVGGEWRGAVPTDSAWLARTFRPSPTLVLSAVALLPERVSPEDFRISTHEWPAAATTSSWRTLASLRSGA